MLVTDLFIIAKTWNQPRCPSVHEWINKLWSLQKVEYYSVLKRNELSSHEKTWRKCKCILLSDRSQSEEATYYMTFRKSKTTEIIKRLVVARGYWEESDE